MTSIRVRIVRSGDVREALLDDCGELYVVRRHRRRGCWEASGWVPVAGPFLTTDPRFEILKGEDR